MSAPASILIGAQDRLLPASIPFRYFAAAAGFHMLAWALLLASAPELATFEGGPGLILSTLHLMTLGVLTMSAMGAGYQLLPVATGAPIRHVALAKLSFWLFAPGTLLLAFGMVDATGAALYTGAGGVVGGLGIFALLTGGNLLRAGAMGAVVAHGWAALAALAGFSALGISLLANYELGFLSDPAAIAAMHMILACFGFMGLLVLGFSHILIPMFLLSRAIPSYAGAMQLGTALAAVALTITGIFMQNPWVLSIGMVMAVLACGIYLALMISAFRARMRRRTEPFFKLVAASWVILAAAMLLGLALQLGFDIENGATLFWFLILAGWLLTFLGGILQRILPFLASMHVMGPDGMPPLLSELSLAMPLKIHGICQIMAIILLSAGIVLETTIFAAIGAGLGLVGAVAFAIFTGHIIIKLITEQSP